MCTVILLASLLLCVLIWSAAADLDSGSSAVLEYPLLSTSSQRVASATNIPTSMELFATLGHDSCADNLEFGAQNITKSGSADGRFRYYLSTNTPGKDIESQEWLQIVTSDGSYEIFRIYWTFSKAKTYSQHILDAVSRGEDVAYRVVDESGLEFSYSGKWRFSTASQVVASMFATKSSYCCFSLDDGVWGAGNGNIDGDKGRGSISSSQFWGIGNYASTDAEQCFLVFAEGKAYYFPNSIPVTYMYHSVLTSPTAVPTLRPTVMPTSTASPTYPVPTPMPSPSSRPTVMGQQLFAVIGGDGCAQDLYYGNQYVTTSGSGDGKHSNYFSINTPYQAYAHTEWLQVVTSDGTAELFRILWTFDTARTLEGHFTAATASSSGAAVSYRIVYPSGDTTEGSFNWVFSSESFDAETIFAETKSSVCCFSSSALWGVGQDTSSKSAVSRPLWGQTTSSSSPASSVSHTAMSTLSRPRGSDEAEYRSYAGRRSSSMSTSSSMGTSSTSALRMIFEKQILQKQQDSACAVVYKNGAAVTASGSGAKSYFFYLADPTAVEGDQTAKYALVSFRVIIVVKGFSAADYLLNVDLYDNLIRKSVAWSLKGVAESDIQDISVSAIKTSSTQSSSSSMSWDRAEDRDAAAIEGEQDGSSPQRSLSTQDSVSITLTVSVQKSAFSYSQLTAQLLNAWVNGDLDIRLNNYAAYLDIPKAVSAKAVSVQTEPVKSTGTSSQHHQSSAPSSAIITTISILGVFVLVMGIVWYFKDDLNMKRIGVITDSWSNHSIDVEAPVIILPRSASYVLSTNTTAASLSETDRGGSRSARSVRSARRMVPLPEFDLEASDHHDDDNNNDDDGNNLNREQDDEDDVGGGGDIEDNNVTPQAPYVPALPVNSLETYTIVRSTRVQPRGAASIDFASNQTRRTHRRGDLSARSDVVEITPRGVQLAGSTPRSSNLTPIVRAQMVQQQPRHNHHHHHQRQSLQHGEHGEHGDNRDDPVLSVPASAVMALPMLPGQTRATLAVARATPM